MTPATTPLLRRALVAFPAANAISHGLRSPKNDSILLPSVRGPSLLGTLSPTVTLLGRSVPATAAPFTTSPLLHKKPLPPRPKPPPESEIEESFLKGSGPGGQKINKTNSAVQLRHTPTGIVVKCQATRSREQNRKIARELLAQKLDELINGDKSRTAIVSEIKRKKAASRAKKARRKYRKLEEAKKQAARLEEGGNEGKEFEEEEEEEEEGEKDEDELDTNTQDNIKEKAI